MCQKGISEDEKDWIAYIKIIVGEENLHKIALFALDWIQAGDWALRADDLYDKVVSGKMNKSEFVVSLINQVDGLARSIEESF